MDACEKIESLMKDIIDIAIQYKVDKYCLISDFIYLIDIESIKRPKQEDVE